MMRRDCGHLATVAILATACGAPAPGAPPRVSESQSFERAEPIPSGFREVFGDLTASWSGSARADLEISIKRGVAFAEVSSGSVRRIARCTATAQYGYVSRAPLTIRYGLQPDDPLYAIARDRLGASRTAPDYDSQIVLELVLVGSYATTVPFPSMDASQGDCQSVTHMARRVAVGAFTVAAVSARGKEVLISDGDPARCAGGGSASPPSGCSSPVAVLLEPLPKDRPVAPGPGS